MEDVCGWDGRWRWRDGGYVIHHYQSLVCYWSRSQWKSGSLAGSFGPGVNSASTCSHQLRKPDISGICPVEEGYYKAFWKAGDWWFCIFELNVQQVCLCEWSVQRIAPTCRGCLIIAAVAATHEEPSCFWLQSGLHGATRRCLKSPVCSVGVEYCFFFLRVCLQKQLLYSLLGLTLQQTDLFVFAAFGRALAER